MDMSEFETLRNRSSKVSFWAGFVNALPLNSPTMVNIDGKKIESVMGAIQSAGRRLSKSIQTVNFNDQLWVAYVGPYVKKEKKAKVVAQAPVVDTRPQAPRQV